MGDKIPLVKIVLGIISTIVFIILVIIGVWVMISGISRYQARANAKNQVTISNIEIRNQAQRVIVAEQQAQIRFENAVGIRKAQDEIARTLTPLYVQFEYVQALQSIAQSGRNNSTVFIPVSPRDGLPLVPTVSATGGQ